MKASKPFKALSVSVFSFILCFFTLPSNAETPDNVILLLISLFSAVIGLGFMTAAGVLFIEGDEE